MSIATALLAAGLMVHDSGANAGLAQSAGEITGELQRWHPVTITFDGPEASETGPYNPFRGYRLNVTFRHEGGQRAFVVPGYFAADGDAATTGADSGNKWRVHFTPGETGTWSYVASFRQGDDVAVSLSPTAGEGVAFDGARGTFAIAETDKSGRDHRGKGMLRYVGEHYLRFDNGEWFLKGGADAPETLFAYEDFDGTYTHGDEEVPLLLWGSSEGRDRRGSSPIKTFSAHVRDWNAGDPVWRGDKGKGLIGALNYLAGKGMNAFSFMPFTAGGDGKNVWPWINHMEWDRYDVSKLAQWEIVFNHADRLGLFIHVKTHETETDQMLDGGSLGPLRKLYYRELVARFAHHHALNWNLGEEHDLWAELNDPQMELAKADARYLHAIDPYHHPVVIHSYPRDHQAVYAPLLEFEYLEGASVQTSNMRPWDNFDVVLEWVTRSRQAGRRWVVSVDEPGSGGLGVSTDDWDDNYNQDSARQTLWAVLAAGGAGVEWLFGYQEEHNDLNAEDWRSRDALWDFTRHALEFYRHNQVPFWRMANANSLTRDEKSFVFASPGEVYVIYAPDGGPVTLDLEGHEKAFTVEWYNPRTGGALQRGRVPEARQPTYVREPASVLAGVPPVGPPVVQGGQVVEVRGPGRVSLGMPPAEVREDWVVLVRARD